MSLKRFTRRLAWKMRYAADRIDPEGAPRILTGWRFTFEKGRGLLVRHDGRGCQIHYLAYIGADECEKAHSESDTSVRERMEREKNAAWLDEMERDGDERQRAAAARMREVSGAA